MSVPTTLKGFRTQYLYTLYAMLHDKSINTVFIPEGKEDLDIVYGDGRKVFIQVKNLSTPVTYSSLISKGKTTSFSERLLESIDSNRTKGIIISFGPISKELTDKNALRKAIKRHLGQSVKNQYIGWLVDNIECREVAENDIYDSCNDLIKETFPAMSTEVCILYLIQWIYESAEKQVQLTYSDLIRQVNEVGKFIQNKHTFDTTFGKDIIPCSTIKLSTSIDKLQRDFYEGISVSYQHVMAELGVKRVCQLDRINKLFTSSSVVIIHGASGQGKSMLAYQYLQQVVGESFSYLVPNLNYTNLNSVITSLSAFSSNLNIPITVYVDININDDAWIKLIQSLKDNDKIRILISIREEEWNVCKNRLLQFGFISDLFLDLQEAEAKSIYERLKSSCATRYNSFGEAWYIYKGGNTLLEFIYLLTHGVSLESKVKSQIDDLIRKHDNESLILLKYISLAVVMAGEIDLDNLRNLHVVNSDLLDAKILQLQNEYFSYSKKTKTIKGVHPIRSKFILDALTMDNKEEIIRSGLKLFPGIAYKSRYYYLLNLVKVGLSLDNLMGSLEGYNLSDPTIYYPLLETILWFGIKDYKDKNQVVIDKFVQNYNALWVAMAGLNFTEVDTDESLSKLLNSYILNNAFEMRKCLSPRQKVFDYALHMLKAYPKVFTLSSPDDAEAIGEILLYQSIVNSKSCQLGNFSGIEKCGLSQLATLLLGLKSSYISKYDNVIDKAEFSFVHKLRTKYDIIRFEIGESEIISKSFLNYSSAQQETKAKNVTLIEQHNLDIIDLCRCAFPDKQRYTSELCNDDFIGYICKQIPTSKSISRDNLPLDELVEIGSTLGGIVRYEQNISDNIGDYFNNLEVKIQELYRHIDRVTKLFLNYLLHGNKESLEDVDSARSTDQTINKLSSPDIPRTNLNPWGLNCKFKSVISTNADFEDILVKYKDAVNNFFTSIKNFVNQYHNAMYDILHGMKESQTIRVATYNLQEAVRQFYELRCMANKHFNEYKQCAEKEERSIVWLWLCWFAIVRRSVPQKFSINSSYQNYMRDLHKIIDDITHFVSKELTDQGISNEIKYDNHAIKVWIFYSTYSEFNECGVKVVEAVRHKIEKQTIYSTNYLIESITIKNVEVHPILVSPEGRRMSLDGGFMSYSWTSITDLEKTSPLPLLCYAVGAKWVNNHEGARLVTNCNHTSANLSLVRSQYDNIDINKLDKVGKEIFWSYITKMEKTALSFDNGSFTKLKEYMEANENKSWSPFLVNIFGRICDYFIDVIVSIDKNDHSWLTDNSFFTMSNAVAEAAIKMEIEMVTKS